MRSGTLLIVATAAVLALVLGACGSSSTSAPPTTVATTPTTAGPTTSTTLSKQMLTFCSDYGRLMGMAGDSTTAAKKKAAATLLRKLAVEGPASLADDLKLLADDEDKSAAGQSVDNAAAQDAASNARGVTQSLCGFG